MGKVAFLTVFILCTFGNTISQEINSPAHHLKDGTFTNTTGISNNKSLKEIYNWMIDKSREKPNALDFNLVSPNFDLINQAVKGKTITWIGHASFLYQNQELNILMDPHLTERASPLSFAGPKRYTPPGMKLGQLPKIDIVTISHNHYDHLDIKTVQRIAKDNPGAVFLVPLGLKQWFLNQSITNVIELDWWEKYVLKGTTVTFTPVQHWSSRTLLDRNKSLWGGWHFKNSYHSLVHLGDTGYTNDFKEINEKLGSVDLALIPIGAYEPRWFMKFSHMNPTEAVQAFIDLGAKKAIGMHWGSFILTDEPVDEPPRLLKEVMINKFLKEDLFVTLKHGETIALTN
jgi:N-acyl-phosphatidylethanolamine-hydrolysing phospholipase D|tara:strand:- start:1115 stop:2146 length:1032 start_codon:yes stop_codon:yes gene_type:complete